MKSIKEWYRESYQGNGYESEIPIVVNQGFYAQSFIDGGLHLYRKDHQGDIYLPDDEMGVFLGDFNSKEEAEGSYPEAFRRK